MEKNANTSSRQERVFAIIESKKYAYRCYDLVEYKNFKGLIGVNLIL